MTGRAATALRRVQRVYLLIAERTADVLTADASASAVMPGATVQNVCASHRAVNMAREFEDSERQPLNLTTHADARTEPATVSLAGAATPALMRIHHGNCVPNRARSAVATDDASMEDAFAMISGRAPTAALVRDFDLLLAKNCSEICATVCAHGRCNNNECVCESGYRGSRCNERDCPPGCAEHGACNNDGVCECNDGYAGANCALGSFASSYAFY